MHQAPNYFLGIDLGGTHIKSALLDINLNVITERSDPTNASKGPDHVLRTMKSIVRKMMQSQGLKDEHVAGMGLGIPGLLDPKEGLSIFSPNFPGWENIHVVREMSKNLSFPVFIDNDVRVNLYGEWHYGAGKGRKNLVLITIGTGLGSGVVVDGKVLYGTTSSVGEIGHMNMYRAGRPCRCGSSGCLGRYVSAIGMVRTCVEKLESGAGSVLQTWVNGDYKAITAKLISDAYDLEDPLAIEVMHETGTLLGFGLSNVINLFNPELIIIGGGVSAAGDRLLNTVRETIRQHTLQLSSGACSVVTAHLGGRAGMIGAAAYAKERLESAR
ncbi:glucokinase [Paenibacillus agaridevorans]|uniref:Glucokinase n=1 Tax=Paenibacillus agaridevorans TaxID=171404 RepID=A0A2R5EYG1_9BACL|nr:ROK family protein [Paenibacillus agaridevorans]GBG11155.1 glucokinase [Paenibacillus agaridevorans]